MLTVAFNGYIIMSTNRNIEGEEMREYLVDLRNNANLSQQDVADYIGVTRQYYNAIENGSRQKKMDITLITKLSKLFDLSLQQICSYENAYRKN